MPHPHLPSFSDMTECNIEKKKKKKKSKDGLGTSSPTTLYQGKTSEVISMSISVQVALPTFVFIFRD